MKHYLRLLLITLFFLPSLACEAINTPPKTVQGSGNIIEQTVEVSNFDRVRLAASGDVYIEQGDAESLTIEADDNILPLLVSNLSDGTELLLGTKPMTSMNPSKPIVYRLTVKNLVGISISGSGNVYAEPIQSTSMKITLSGSGNIDIKGLESDSLSIALPGSGKITIDDVSVKAVDTDAKGSGDIKLSGKSDKQTVSYSGSGTYQADDLESVSADIRVPGSADITVWVTDQLNVHVDGSGTIRYYGKPTVEQGGAGSGKISSLGEK